RGLDEPGILPVRRQPTLKQRQPIVICRGHWRRSAGILFLALFCAGGCSCSSSVPDSKLPRDGASDDQTTGGYVPPTILSREWHANAPPTAGSSIANKLNIRLFSESEVLSVGKTREPFVVNAGDHQAALMAHTCTNPTCAAQGSQGRPLLFTRSLEEYYMGSNGRVMSPTPKDLEAAEAKMVWG